MFMHNRLTTIQTFSARADLIRAARRFVWPFSFGFGFNFGFYFYFSRSGGVGGSSA